MHETYTIPGFENVLTVKVTVNLDENGEGSINIRSKPACESWIDATVLRLSASGLSASGIESFLTYADSVIGHGIRAFMLAQFTKNGL